MNIIRIFAAIGYIFLSKASPAHASNNVTVFGLTGSEAVSYFTNNPTKPFKLYFEDGAPIHMICISRNGVKEAGGYTVDPETPSDALLRIFNTNKPQIAADMLNMSSAIADISGICVGKREISIAATTYKVSAYSILGTNGNVVLEFKDSRSLISSLTFLRSSIRTKLFGEDLQIGSFWGNFNGVPSYRAQIIYIVGYPSVEVVINIEALNGLLSR